MRFCQALRLKNIDTSVTNQAAMNARSLVRFEEISFGCIGRPRAAAFRTGGLGNPRGVKFAARYTIAQTVLVLRCTSMVGWPAQARAGMYPWHMAALRLAMPPWEPSIQLQQSTRTVSGIL